MSTYGTSSVIKPLIFYTLFNMVELQKSNPSYANMP